MTDTINDCVNCGNSYLTIRTDVYKDKRQFIYCDVCGAMADRRTWKFATQTPDVKNSHAEFIRVIQFSIAQGMEASEFLNAWLHGDTSEWPEFDIRTTDPDDSDINQIHERNLEPEHIWSAASNTNTKDTVIEQQHKTLELCKKWFAMLDAREIHPKKFWQ